MVVDLKIQDSLAGELMSNTASLQNAIQESWKRIAPTWPLKNLIAANPLAGFEDLPFEEALAHGRAHFQASELSDEMKAVNVETIKWLQLFFDQGQAKITMPSREKGLLYSVLELAQYDKNLTAGNSETKKWLHSITINSESAEKIIQDCLERLNLPKDQYVDFLTLMLTTLPGWASYVQYRVNWPDHADKHHSHKVTQSEYLALRLVLTVSLWPSAADLLGVHKQTLKAEKNKKINFDKAENAYRKPLLKKLSSQKISANTMRAKAQLVFCIDVRSEPFRRALEKQDAYETLGFAGFFGVPIEVEDQISAEQYASCPVLLQPAHKIQQKPTCNHEAHQKTLQNKSTFKRLYQSVKYNFTTPFALVETLGPLTGVWMAIKSLSPGLYKSLFEKSNRALTAKFDIEVITDNISFEDKCAYAMGALSMMGLTENFAPLVILCGHGSATTNNAYETGLDCGACGGRHGAPNARVLASILNDTDVREHLHKHNISIPQDTIFLAAEHNTTTDDVEIFSHAMPDDVLQQLSDLNADLTKAKIENSRYRIAELEAKPSDKSPEKQTRKRSVDWAQVRPEWALSRNASFIIGPRAITKNIDLNGRSFLHSYEWEKDADGASLTTILTAPMVVAQWINAQYFFSTLDNVAYGGGSKVTKNITGKIGVMQGNASDLMHGLALQSVYSSDENAYHESLRLMTVVYAPREHIDPIIKQHDILKKLFGNEWVKLACIEPKNSSVYLLDKNLKWVPETL